MYIHFGQSLSNRRVFSRNFILLALTVMLIITIVKSSLALSLGLVGALSIVRYRAPIKEPEELGYLFLAITIGLGMGADQRLVTILAFLVIMAILWLRSLMQKTSDTPNMHLTISANGGHKVKLEDIVNTISPHCSSLSLKRFDESDNKLEAAFLVEYRDFKYMEEGRTALRKLDSTMTISLLDNKGLI
jgi:uncharacterized membrane protein YhiD involved in acid resistance